MNRNGGLPNMQHLWQIFAQFCIHKLYYIKIKKYSNNCLILSKDFKNSLNYIKKI
jgi:hypothetical protein